MIRNSPASTLRPLRLCTEKYSIRAVGRSGVVNQCTSRSTIDASLNDRSGPSSHQTQTRYLVPLLSPMTLTT